MPEFTHHRGIAPWVRDARICERCGRPLGTIAGRTLAAPRGSTAGPPATIRRTRCKKVNT